MSLIYLKCQANEKSLDWKMQSSLANIMDHSLVGIYILRLRYFFLKIFKYIFITEEP